MSDNSDEEDAIDNIDFSVISTAIETGGKTLDQILNAVHYGSPEVRFLLREACDFIFECKHCKNLFRAIPNFIAHKRIYCGERAFFPQNTPKKKTKKKEETVIVRPVSPSLSVPIETSSNNGGKTVLEQILTGSFQGNSDEYKHYTTAAEVIEKQKLNTTSIVITKTPIKNTEKAVNIELVDMSESNQNVSNASIIIAKAKKAQKQPLTKIVDNLKKSVKTSKDVDTGSSSPNKSTTNSQPSTSVRKNVSPQKNSKNQTRNDISTPEKVKDKKVEPKTSKETLVQGKTAKVVLKPLSQLMKSPEVFKKVMGKKSNSSNVKSMEVGTSTEVVEKKSNSSDIKPIEVGTSTEAVKKVVEKKSTSSNNLRPVKSQDGSELSELSQLGHCDIKQLKCLICNLQYSQKKTLLQHMHVIHSGTKKKYPCNICKKQFDYFWGLTRHLLLIHKKTKEEVDKMRPELRALAYTITENDNEESAGQSAEKNGSNSTTSRMKQKTVVKMSTCKGCNKSFWKKVNYQEHLKQCRFLSEKHNEKSEKDSLDDSKEKKQNKTQEQSENGDQESVETLKDKKPNKSCEQSEKDEKEILKETIAARRKRVLEKLAESRRLKEDSEDANSDDETEKNSSLNKNKSAIAAAKRFRVDGKFVSKEVALTMLEKQRREEKSEINENKRKSNKNRVVQKLKEKSRSYVPAQRFISTRRSAEFYHSPAQRTRFHEKRRAVVESPKKDNRTPTKSPTKTSTEPKTSVNKEQKKSPQEKSELELARRNLLNAIEKVKADSNTEKPTVLSGKTNDNRKSIGKSQTDKKGEETRHTEKGKTPEVDRSRSSVKRNQKTPRGVSSVEGVKTLNRKETPSRDTSVESVRSRQSSRSRRDVSCDKSIESTSTRRSRQTVKNNRAEDILSRSRSRDTSVESTRSSQKSSAFNERSRSSVRTSKCSISESRDSSRDSIRTRSSDNLTEVRCPTRITRHSDSELSENSMTKISPMSEKSPQIGKQCKDKTKTDSPGEKKDGENIRKSIGGNTHGVNITTMVSTDKSPGKDEIDGTTVKSVEKTRPKWSSKNWTNKKIEPKSNEDQNVNEKSNEAPNVNEKSKEESSVKERNKQEPNVKEKNTQEPNVTEKNKQESKVTEKNKQEPNVKEKTTQELNVKEKNKQEPNVKEIKEKSQKTVATGTVRKGKLTKGKLKGTTKPKILKGKARYSTRSMKTRVQTAKKIGVLKKRSSTRISDLKKNIDDDVTKSKQGTDKKDKRIDNVTKSKESMDKKDKNIDDNVNVTKSKKCMDKKDKNSDDNVTKSKQNTDKKDKNIDDNVTKSKQIMDKKDKNIDDNVTKSKQNTDKKDKNNDVDQTEISQKKRNDTTDKTVQDTATNIESKDEKKTIKEEKSPQASNTSQQVAKEKVTTDYTHRQRNPSDMAGVRVIEEIWVSKEPGKPLQNVKCKKTIIDSPKKVRSSRMYVVDPVKPEKPKCMDFSRINHLVDYKNNKCLQCGLELTDISSLRRHAVRHLGWKRYKCKLCAYTGFNRSECNSHIKRRHAEKLITSSAPLSTFIIDLNKEASHVRNKKKQTTLLKKNKSNIATRSSSNKSSTQTKPKRKSVAQKSEETKSKEEKADSVPDSSEAAVVSPPTADDESKLTRKRKRIVSEEGVKTEDNINTEQSNSGKTESEISETEQTVECDEDLDEDIGSVSDYDEGEPPPRNVVSPTWTKMNPNVALMMATLEEARATKFSRGKRGRGGIRRFSSPLKKLPRLSTEDPDEQTDNILSDGEIKPEIQHCEKQETSETNTENDVSHDKQETNTENNVSHDKVQLEKSDSIDTENKQCDTTGIVDTDDSKQEVVEKDCGIDEKEKTCDSVKEMPQVKDEGCQT